MGLVATLKSIKDNTDVAALNRYNPERPIVMDGSLSEIVSQALNIVHSKKNITTGEPYYGEANPTGNPPPGAGTINNIFALDSPNAPAPVIPTLESMQMDEHAAVNSLAHALNDVVSAESKEAADLKEKPVMAYAIPRNGVVPEEMNANIDMYHDSGAVNIHDFVFVFTDSRDPKDDVQYDVVDINQKLVDYEGRGARVYQDLESFTADLPNIRMRRRK